MKALSLFCNQEYLLTKVLSPYQGKAIIWVVVFGLGWTTVLAQKKVINQGLECRDMIDTYMNGLEKYANPSGNQRYHMRMKVTTIPWPGTVAARARLSSRDIVVDVTIGKGRIEYESTYLSVYQDASNMFTVVHPRKTILWSKPDPGMKKGREVLAQNLSAGQRKVLEASSVHQCRDTLYQGVLTKIIEFLPNKQAREEFKIKRAVYYYSPAQNKLQKQIVEFTDRSPIARQIIIYDTLETHYRGRDPKAAASYIFSRSNGAVTSAKNLIDRYRNYRIERE